MQAIDGSRKVIVKAADGTGGDPRRGRRPHRDRRSPPRSWTSARPDGDDAS
ncbi:hypothetical protein ACRAWF_22190 [Streptomyces sp. L7]